MADALRTVSRGGLRTLALVGQLVLVLGVLAVGSATGGLTPPFAMIGIFAILLAIAIRYGGGPLEAPSLTVLLGAGIYAAGILPLSVARSAMLLGSGVPLAIAVLGAIAAVRRTRRRAAAV